MPEPTNIPPTRRADLVLGAAADNGAQVVKDPLTGEFFHLGPEEAFLLAQLDGRKTTLEILAAYQAQFGDTLTTEDLDAFLEIAKSNKFLQTPNSSAVLQPAQDPQQLAEPDPTPEQAKKTAKSKRWSFETVLYWRVNFFNPNDFLTWLEPKIRFVWTWSFACVSLCTILAALVLVISEWRELISYLPAALRWETILLGWVTIVLATFLHEFAHGLTCKHYGGDVREVGFLFLFGIPSFYCNVSDAWLFPKKSARLLVTLAGGYCDLCVWALSVFVWRLTPPESTQYYVAYILLTVCGSRVFFNFNPLLKLDGYYLLSDWMEVPNLKQRGQDRFTGWLRCLFWGGRRPEAEPSGKPLFVLGYGLASWLMSVVYLGLSLVVFIATFGSSMGVFGQLLAVAIGMYLGRSLFADFTKGEFVTMLRSRLIRTAVWLVVIGAIVSVMVFVDIEDRRSGAFQVRPARRAELRARVGGFLKQINYEEGDKISEGATLALLEVPDLDSKISGKKSEIREVAAKLRLLEIGPRPEEMREQKAKIERAVKWRDQAISDLKAARATLLADLARLNKQITSSQSELEYARYAFDRDHRLYMQDILPKDQYRDKKKALEVRESTLSQAKAEKQAREAKGVVEAETELARREKELADARGVLGILEAGTRPEEIEAERAKLARFREELAFLEGQQQRLAVMSPIAGTVITPRLKEKIGQHLKEGDPICVVDCVDVLDIEVNLDEQDIERVKPGTRVDIKARSFIFRTYQGEVSHLAPAARREQLLADPTKGPTSTSPPRVDTPGTIIAYVTLKDSPEGLRPGMTGTARLYCGQRRIGAIVLERAVRMLRVDYWW